MSDSDQHQFKDRYMLRLPDGMRDRIKAAAEENNRSMNAEIVARLDMTFRLKMRTKTVRFQSDPDAPDFEESREDLTREVGSARANKLLETLSIVDGDLRAKEAVHEHAAVRLELARSEYVAARRQLEENPEDDLLYGVICQMAEARLKEAEVIFRKSAEALDYQREVTAQAYESLGVRTVVDVAGLKDKPAD